MPLSVTSILGSFLFISYLFMGIGTYFYEYNPEFSPELQTWGYPTESLLWLATFLILLILVFQLASRRPILSNILSESSYLPLVNLSLFSGFFLFPISFTAYFSGAANRYELNTVYQYIVSYFSPLGYIPPFFLALLFFGDYKSSEYQYKKKLILRASISLALWFSSWFLLRQKGTPFILSFSFFISVIFSANVYRFQNALSHFFQTLKIRKTYKKRFSITKTFKRLLTIICLFLIVNLVFYNLKANLSYDSKRSESRIIELYLYNRIARQGQLFSTSFSRPLFPSESNNLETQILGKRFYPYKYVGMKGAMDFLMPSKYRLQHTGSLTMLFPSINISIFGSVIGLFISIIMCFMLTLLVSFQINQSAKTLNRYSWFYSIYPFASSAISLLLFKYFTNILFRGDLSNFSSPYFLFLVLCTVILNRKQLSSASLHSKV